MENKLLNSLTSQVITGSFGKRAPDPPPNNSCMRTSLPWRTWVILYKASNYLNSFITIGFFSGLELPAKTAVAPVSENTTRNLWVDILRVVVTVIMSFGMIMNYLKVSTYVNWSCK